MTRPAKITFGELRSMGLTGVLIYRAADGWDDDVRLSDIEPELRLQRLRQAGCGCEAEFREP